MAFINNTPMIVGGGTPTPTPITKKYKLKKVDIPTTIINSTGTIHVDVQPNEYMTNFWQWLWENSCPGLWELIVTTIKGSAPSEQYGLTPSYPIKGIFGSGTNAKINFATNESYDVKSSAYESVVLTNAVVLANTNRLTFDLSDLSYRKDTPDKTGLLATKRQPLVSDTKDLIVVVRIMVLEESEE